MLSSLVGDLSSPDSVPRKQSQVELKKASRPWRAATTPRRPCSSRAQGLSVVFLSPQLELYMSRKHSRYHVKPTGARAKAWCLIIQAEVSLSPKIITLELSCMLPTFVTPRRFTW